MSEDTRAANETHIVADCVQISTRFPKNVGRGSATRLQHENTSTNSTGSKGRQTIEAELSQAPRKD